MTPFFLRPGWVVDKRVQISYVEHTSNATSVASPTLSKVENETLAFADYPSRPLICKFARTLGADEDELLLLAEKIPEDQEEGAGAARRLPETCPPG